ncbi:hypothetical protein PMAYCL1PPCAC_06905, partial [Pristionchus mayeri]
LFSLFSLSNQSSDLSPLSLCSSYSSCKREWLRMEEHCEHLESIEGKPKRRVEFVPVKNERVVEDKTICAVDLHPHYSRLRKHLLRFRREVNRCIADSLLQLEEDKKEIEDLPFEQYCSMAMASELLEFSSLPSSSHCWKAAKIAQRKCSDLRRCCEPAMYCEQRASVSRNGRWMVEVREEIGYRLAACRSMRGGERLKLFHKLDAERGKESDEERKKHLSKSIKRSEKIHSGVEEERIGESAERRSGGDSIVISVAAPLPSDIRSLCTPYINCANQLSDYRLKCSAAQEKPQNGSNYDFHLAYLQLPPLDKRDKECREEWKKLIEKTIGDQKKVGEFMVECVMEGEEETTDTTECDREIFSSPSPSSSLSSCREGEHQRRNRCNALRRCCPPAQRCEKSSSYSSLSNQFLSSFDHLRLTMNACYQKRREATM